MPKTDQKSDYDAVPYASASYPESHPDILAGIGRLFGLDTPDPIACRVLEFACADGSNLLPMACELPGSEFVGIDLSKRQIDVAQHAVSETGIMNVLFHAADLVDADNLLEGEFDYIIAHGLYSWVPGEVKQKLLELTKKYLSPKGVAYISYNTLPGWQPLLALREMMIYHTSAFDDIAQKSSQARALINFLAGAVPENNYYGMLLKSQAREFANYSDAYFTHDWLESQNDPLYLHQFVEEAKQEGLQYLGDVTLPSMFAVDLPDDVVKTLQGLSTDQVQFEQYADFARNRRFRHSLLCHEGRQVVFDLKSAKLDSMYIRSSIISASEKSRDKFISGNGREVAAHNSIARVLLSLLVESYPDSVSFHDFSEMLEKRLASENIQTDGTGDELVPGAGAMTRLLLDAIVRGLAVVTARPFSVARIDDGYPCSSAYAKYQATNSFYVANRLHVTRRLGPVALLLIRYLDGKTSRAELALRLAQAIEAGDITLEEGGRALSAEQISDEMLSGLVEEEILSLSKQNYL